MLIMILIVRAFNNYVDPVLSNFDPHPLEWTKMVILHTCPIHTVYLFLNDPTWTFPPYPTTPSPILFEEFIV